MWGERGFLKELVSMSAVKADCVGLQCLVIGGINRFTILELINLHHRRQQRLRAIAVIARARGKIQMQRFSDT